MQHRQKHLHSNIPTHRIINGEKQLASKQPPVHLIIQQREKGTHTTHSIPPTLTGQSNATTQS